MNDIAFVIAGVLLGMLGLLINDVLRQRRQRRAQEAAELAVLYSSTFKAGTGAKVAVDTTEVKNIWKASGAKPGMVLYEVYTTVYITPREGLEEQLKKK